MNSKLLLLLVVTAMLSLQGCITKVVTVPVKVAYTAGKGVVKGTAAVVGAVTSDDEEKQSEEKHSE